MLSPTAGADIACGAAAVITIAAVYIPLSAKRTTARRTTREYPRFQPMPERTGRFTREPAPVARERENTLVR